MRIFLTTLATAFVVFISFLIVKLWGRSQVYIEYKHPFFVAEINNEPILFYKPSFNNLESSLKSDKNLFLDVVVTQDQKLILLKKVWSPKEKPIRYTNYIDAKSDVVLLEDFKENLKHKKIIFNINDNVQAMHEIFLYNIQQLGLEKTQNFLVTSPFEATIKSLKELAPAFLFGTTQPEILKILAMSSMGLIEATTIRADAIIHPLKIKKQTFYTDEIITEIIDRRKKRIIIGPITASEKEEAIKLKPYGLIIEE